MERPSDVRRQLNLLHDGRAALPDLDRLAQVFSDVLHPNIPAYDVYSVQPIDFDEWTYCEALNCFMAFTQSVEINARVALSAATWAGTIDHDYVADLASALTDKWELAPFSGDATGNKVFFPPGNNIGWITDVNMVRRAFREDRSWRLKPHPISSADELREMKRAFGKSRMFHHQSSGMDMLRQAGKVGYTTASELGLVGMILGKPTIDFSLYDMEGWGRLHSFYHAIKTTAEPAGYTINRLINCPWSGILPLSMGSDEARERLGAYKRKTLELRDHYRPVTVYPLPHPPVEDI